MTRTRPNRVAPPVAYADAIAGAVAFLHAQLRNPDTSVGMTAAMALIDLEKTRMRHGQPMPQIAADEPETDPKIVADSPPVPPPTEGMTIEEMLADPELLDVIRQTRRELERADPAATLTDESVGRMLHERMRALRGASENVRTDSPLTGHCV